MVGFSGSFNGAGLGAGNGYGDAGTPENIDDGDGFDFFKAGREWDEGVFHGASGSVILRRRMMAWPVVLVK